MIRKLIAAALTCAGLSGAAGAQTPQPPVEAYGELPYISSAAISPNGNLFALLMNHEGGDIVAVTNADGEIVAKVDASTVKARSVGFANDSHLVLRASETTSMMGFRGDFEYSAAFIVDLEDGDIRQLLRYERDLLAGQTGLGRIVGYTEDGDALMPAYTGESYSNPDYDLLRADIDSNSVGREKRGTSNTVDWFVDQAGEALVREEYSNSRNRYEIQIARNGWETIYEDQDTPQIPFWLVGLTPALDGLFFVHEGGEDEDFTSIFRLGFDGKITGPHYGREDAGIEVVYSDKNRRVIGLRYSGMYPSYEFFDERLQESINETEKSFPQSAIFLDSWSDDKSRVLYRIFGTFGVDAWILHDLENGSYKALSRSRLNIPTEAVGEVLTIEYPAGDGLNIPAILTLPPGKTLTNDLALPLIVMPHGGPHAYDRVDFDWMAQFFANRGYLVFQPNFRGSEGFGRSFRKAGNGEWGRKMQDDVTEGVQRLINGGYADADRICIVGASYGGYSALAGGAFTPDLYKCVAALAPVTDLSDMYSSDRARYGRNHWVIDYLEDSLGGGELDRDALRDVSPVNFAEDFSASVLLLHGDDDTVVPISQSRQMERALDRAGKPVEFVRLRGEDHWLSSSETRLASLRALDEFVSRHIGPDAP